MKQDQIVEIATDVWGNPNWNEIQVARLKRFAEIIKAMENEECALIADKYIVPMCDGVADIIGKQIRARVKS